MTDDLIALIAKRAGNPKTIHDMAEGLSPAPIIAPKATPDQIAKAEKKLGKVLPPLLKRIYAEIGNGGFGPGYGLYACDDLIDDAEEDGIIWKKGMLPLLTWGCGILTCVDLTDSKYPIFAFDPGAHCLDNDVEFTLTAADGTVLDHQEIKDKYKDPSKVPAQFMPEKDSIEAFFTDWAAGKDLWTEMMGE
jgi:hypothetical protein